MKNFTRNYKKAITKLHARATTALEGRSRDFMRTMFRDHCYDRSSIHNMHVLCGAFSYHIKEELTKLKAVSIKHCYIKLWNISNFSKIPAKIPRILHFTYQTAPSILWYILNFFLPGDRVFMLSAVWNHRWTSAAVPAVARLPDQ